MKCLSYHSVFLFMESEVLMSNNNGNNGNEKIMPVGGQAVIEGVMMRSPKRIATAIRRASGKIEIRVHEYQSLIERKNFLIFLSFAGRLP